MIRRSYSDSNSDVKLSPTNPLKLVRDAGKHCCPVCQAPVFRNVRLYPVELQHTQFKRHECSCGAKLLRLFENGRWLVRLDRSQPMVIHGR
jgi:hypothetical protein